MKRLYLILILSAVACVGYAQRQKWKAPKCPKPPKWEVPKQKAPEVINVWRPYTVSDNWFLDFNGGMSLSLAENMNGHDFGDICTPMFDFSIGKQFSNVWSTRLTFGYNKQKGWASKEAMAASYLLGNGGYTYQLAVAYIDEAWSLTNLFCRYNELRKLNVEMFVGGGMNYSWGFDDKVDGWYRYGYPVDGTDHISFALRGGLQILLQVSEAMDFSLQGAYTVVDDNFNGVKRKTGRSFDSYVDISLGVRVHLMDHFGNHRYYKVRRWEATALRATDNKVANLLDGEKIKEYEDRGASEVVAFGELMKTRISFYVDRTFVNDYQMENLRIVADFLKKHPDVNLIAKGYCGASTKGESPDMHLAERRVASVRKALTKYYNVEPSRIETVFDEQAVPPFPMKGEWIDGVVFQMVQR